MLGQSAPTPSSIRCVSPSPDLSLRPGRGDVRLLGSDTADRQRHRIQPSNRGFDRRSRLWAHPCGRRGVAYRMPGVLPFVFFGWFLLLAISPDRKHRLFPAPTSPNLILSRSTTVVRWVNPLTFLIEGRNVFTWKTRMFEIVIGRCGRSCVCLFLCGANLQGCGRHSREHCRSEWRCHRRCERNRTQSAHKPDAKTADQRAGPLLNHAPGCDTRRMGSIN
jgi:hypothetical protein